MSLLGIQPVMGFLFVAIWCLIGQIIVSHRRSQQRPACYGAKNA